MTLIKYHNHTGWHYVDHDHREYYRSGALVAVAEYRGDRWKREDSWLVSIYENSPILWITASPKVVKAKMVADLQLEGMRFIEEHFSLVPLELPV